MSIQPRGADNKGGRGSQGDFFYLGIGFGVTNDDTYFYPPFGDASSNSTTETLVDLECDFDFLLRRVRTTVFFNTATGTTTISFRRNAANVAGTVLTYATTVTGDNASGILSQRISAGDLIGWRVDMVTAAAEGINGIMYAICERIRD